MELPQQYKVTYQNINVVDVKPPQEVIPDWGYDNISDRVNDQQVNEQYEILHQVRLMAEGAGMNVNNQPKNRVHQLQGTYNLDDREKYRLFNDKPNKSKYDQNSYAHIYQSWCK